jgi:putative transposase
LSSLPGAFGLGTKLNDEQDHLSRLPLPARDHQRAIWLYYRFTLSLHDVEELLAERGVEVTYETIRQWGIRFAIAWDLRSRRPRPNSRWHMDEMFVSIGGKRIYLLRAVDHEGEVVDCLVQSRRNRRAATKLMRKLLKQYGFVPTTIVTDHLAAERQTEEQPC